MGDNDAKTKECPYVGHSPTNPCASCRHNRCPYCPPYYPDYPIFPVTPYYPYYPWPYQITYYRTTPLANTNGAAPDTWSIRGG
mgnify:CR=1 FL=1